MAMADERGPLAQVHQRYVQAETHAASALESVVGSNAFGELLAKSASNAMALARLANGGIDRGVRALRVAGRADVADLARQNARTEDKLERMLQLIEELEGRLEAREAPLVDAAALAFTASLADAAPLPGAEAPADAAPMADAAAPADAARARAKVRASRRRAS
jgi:hypothetical protein